MARTNVAESARRGGGTLGATNPSSIRQIRSRRRNGLDSVFSCSALSSHSQRSIRPARGSSWGSGIVKAQGGYRQCGQALPSLTADQRQRLKGSSPSSRSRFSSQQADHSCISEFRRRNLDALKGLFIQILCLCQKDGMVSLDHVALDGTKVQALGQSMPLGF